ncbi:hypothetical protein [uncultured Gimesia sp.]|uniref:hypothetical protein n=1 Tax=uncultured Gimesia sp. TaxID=1678688 RepID=UPI00263A102D|nr:hypothetical protein [uncultured Gimesia sp.]
MFLLADIKFLWQSASPVNEKNDHTPFGESIDELQQTVEELSQEVRVLRDVLDEIREDFSWALRNGHSESIEEAVADNIIDSEHEPTEKYVKQSEPEEVSIEEPVTSLLANNTEGRINEHEEWVKIVRDPAQKNSEGLRKLQADNGKATAEYEVAPLPDGGYAIRITLSYHCGDTQGTAIPWSEYDSREACINQFESRAKQFFQKPIDNGGNEAQQVARKEMLKHFEDSLFGFVEPDVSEEERVVTENVDDEKLVQLKHRILEYLSANVVSVKLSDIRNDMGFSEIDSADPLANPVNHALVALEKAGNVSVIETDFGEPSFLFQRPLYLRPDRQNNFSGLPFYEWPEPEEGRDALTVDRVGSNGDGGEHRFTVKRGDTVEAFFSKDKQKIGKVVGLSHANREVGVAFREGTEGIWFAIGSIYPALEPASDEDLIPLSDVIEKANDQNTPQEKEWSEADRVSSSNKKSADVFVPDSHSKGVKSLTDNHRSYTLNDFQAFLQRVESGDISVSVLQAEFAHLNSSRGAFIQQLLAEKNAKELRILACRFGSLDAKRNTKQQNAESVIRSMMLAYTLKNSVTYQPFSGETYEDAIIKVVESITDEQIQEQITKRNEESAQVEKSLTNPETFREFRYFVERKGESQLSQEQLIQYDRLRAEQTRLQRSNKKTATVEQFNGDIEGLQITIKEGYHTRQEIPLWICQLGERVDRTTFNDLKIKAKQLGGWWSSFRKDDAGFQFKNEDSAEKFQSLLQGNADRTDELEDRKTRKIESASERLLQLADDLEQCANESLHQDRQTNTVRRSEMAAGIRGRAYVDIAFAGTMRSLATDLTSGEVIYLDGIRAKTQLQTLIDVLRRAKRSRNELLLKEKGELGVWDRHNAVEELDNRPINLNDADFAEYPYPNIYKQNLEAVIQKALHRKGVMQRANKIQKQISLEADFIQFKEEYEIKEFAEFCTRCKETGIDVQWLESTLDDYKRLHAANIHTLPELRMALRELVPHLQKRQEDDPVLKAEQAIVGKKLDGFFPTPKPIISRMLELAEIQEGDRILEPSAGKGDILDMIRLHHPENEITAIERNGTLFDVLEAKGHSVKRADFLEHQGEYNHIIMNPPFEKGADIEHVLHAFSLLAPNGKLVAIMSEGPFFRNDNQATEFRNWLDEVGGESEQLPEDAFNNAEAFRKTGVRTRIVTITK